MWEALGWVRREGEKYEEWGGRASADGWMGGVGGQGKVKGPGNAFGDVRVRALGKECGVASESRDD